MPDARALIRAGLGVALVALAAIPLATAAAVWANAQSAPAEEAAEAADSVAGTGVIAAEHTPGASQTAVVDGERVFADSCASCHGVNGGGRIGPRLAGNDNLRQADYVMALILRGGDGMPAFHDRLSEAQIVAVTEYIRTSWGNRFSRGGELAAGGEFAVGDDLAGDDERGGGDLTGGGPSAGNGTPLVEAGVESVSEETLESRWWTGADDAGDLYRRVCARCHGVDGGGGFGPPLAGNDNLSDSVYTVGKILHGQGGMPAFEGILTSVGITELASYIRSSFGNSYGEVQLETTLALHSTSPSTGTGSLAVTLIPRGARLVVVGPDRFVRILAGTGRLVLEGLAPGEYRLTASAAGYDSEVESAQVLPGERTRASLVLPSPEREPRAQTEAGASEVSGATPLPSEQDEAFVSPPAPPWAVLDTETVVGMRPATDTEAAAEGGAPGQAERRAVYQSSCALCHGPRGEGGIGPALAGNQNLQSGQFVLQRVLQGAGRMPAFSDRLDDRQIAAAASHEMSSWGNSFGEVTAQQVAGARGSDGPWSDAAWPATTTPGEELYERHCAACHGGQGGGIVAPGFRGNARLADASYVVSRVVMGGGGMPAFHDLLSTAEMAAVSSFIREAWGNDFGRVSLPRARNYHGGRSSLQE